MKKILVVLLVVGLVATLSVAKMPEQGPLGALQEQVDSFFDVFTEVTELYTVDSFFDVFVEIDTRLDDLQAQIDAEEVARIAADAWLQSQIWSNDAMITQLGECSCCIPQCAGKECGPDGCGWHCGECDVTEGCFDGQCEYTGE